MEHLQDEASSFFGAVSTHAEGHVSLLKTILESLNFLQEDNQELRQQLQELSNHKPSASASSAECPKQILHDVHDLFAKTETDNEYVQKEEFEIRLNEFLQILNQYDDPKINEVKEKITDLLSEPRDSRTAEVTKEVKDLVGDAKGKVPSLSLKDVYDRISRLERENAELRQQSSSDPLGDRISDLEERVSQIQEEMNNRPVELTTSPPSASGPIDVEDMHVDLSNLKESVPRRFQLLEQSVDAIKSRLDALPSQKINHNEPLSKEIDQIPTKRPNTIPEAPVVPEDPIYGSETSAVANADYNQSTTTIVDEPAELDAVKFELADDKPAAPLMGMQKDVTTELEQLREEIRRAHLEIKELRGLIIPSEHLQTEIEDAKRKSNVNIIFENFDLTHKLQDLNARLTETEGNVACMQCRTPIALRSPVSKPKSANPDDNQSSPAESAHPQLPMSPMFIPHDSGEEIAEVRSMVRQLKTTLTQRIDDLRKQIYNIDVVGTPEENMRALQTKVEVELASVRTTVEMKADANSVNILEGLITTKDDQISDVKKVVQDFLTLMSQKVDRSHLDLLNQAIEDIKASLRSLMKTSDYIQEETKQIKKDAAEDKKTLIELSVSVEKKSQECGDLDSDEPLNLDGVLKQLKSHKDWISKNAKELGNVRDRVWQLRDMINKGKGRTGDLPEHFSDLLNNLKTSLDCKASLEDLDKKVDLHYLNNILSRLGDGDHALFSGKIMDPFKCMSCDRPLPALTAEASVYESKPFSVTRFPLGPQRWQSRSTNALLQKDPSALPDAMFYHNSQLNQSKSAALMIKPKTKEGHVSLPELNAGHEI